MRAGMEALGAVRKRVLARWRIPDASRRRQLTAAALNLGVGGASVFAFWAVVPATSWSEPFLLAALAGVAAVSYFAEGRLKRATLSFFGATLIAALIALAVAGPLAALLVWLVPDLIARWLLRREPRLSPGFIATASSYALAILAGAEVLALADSPSGASIAPALFAAGVAMWAVNFAFGRLAVAPFYQGYRPAALIRDEFVALAPTVLGMLLAGVVTAVLVAPLGAGALALLMSVILLPQLALDRLAASASVSALGRPELARLYVKAIGDVLGLERPTVREVLCAVDLLDTTSERRREWRDVDPAGVAVVALHRSERWAGDGWPAGLPGEAIPRQSRVLAVAWQWAELTAHGGCELSQSEAMLALAADAGRGLDPRVVEAAARVVADEEGFAREPSFQPTLHRLPLPRGVRRGALPALLAPDQAESTR